MKLAEKMRVVEIKEPGGPEVLQVAQVNVPVIAPNEVLIKVVAAGVNRPDVLQRVGAYPPPPDASELPGLEVAGKIAAIGASVKNFQIGDRVMALTPGGGYAEYSLADQGAVMPIPPSFSFIQAAAIPETYLTVWHNVIQRGHLRAGEWFLVHGGSSGIGTTAIQIAKEMGAKVMTTAGSDEKCDFCTSLGADCAINYRQQDFVEISKEVTKGKGVDLILDMIAGDYVARNYKAAALDGRIVQIAVQNGPKAQTPTALLMVKRLTHTGSTLRPRSDQFKADLVQDFVARGMPMLESGSIQPVIDKVFPLEEASKAHAYMEASQHMGKIILDVALQDEAD